MNLRQRGADGFPIGADQFMRNAYGPIPESTKFQHHRNYAYETAIEVHGWQWSTTFNRWSARVTFADGWTGFTWPEWLAVSL